MIKVAVGLIFRNIWKEILLCQRRSELPYAFKWEFPGGKVNDGEQIEECLKRELWEELQISIRQGKLYHRRSYDYTSGSFDVYYFLVHSYTGIPTNHAFTEMRWVPINDLNSYDILEGNYATVQKLLTDYGKA